MPSRQHAPRPGARGGRPAPSGPPPGGHGAPVSRAWSQPGPAALMPGARCGRATPAILGIEFRPATSARALALACSGLRSYGCLVVRWWRQRPPPPAPSSASGLRTLSLICSGVLLPPPSERRGIGDLILQLGDPVAMCLRPSSGTRRTALRPYWGDRARSGEGLFDVRSDLGMADSYCRPRLLRHLI